MVSLKSNEDEIENIEEISFRDDYATVVQNTEVDQDEAAAEIEKSPYKNIPTARTHRRASTLMKENLACLNEESVASNHMNIVDDRQTIASSGLYSRCPTVVQEEKMFKTT